MSPPLPVVSVTADHEGIHLTVGGDSSAVPDSLRIWIAEGARTKFAKRKCTTDELHKMRVWIIEVMKDAVRCEYLYWSPIDEKWEFDSPDENAFVFSKRLESEADRFVHELSKDLP